LTEVQTQRLVEAVPKLLVLLPQPTDLGQQLAHQLLERRHVDGQWQVGCRLASQAMRYRRSPLPSAGWPGTGFRARH
jgi:hypothetical protein